MDKLFVLVCTLTLLGCTPDKPAQPKTASLPPPNILLLMAEDMSSRVNAFGDKVAVTPNIDQLANEGVRYPNTFTTAGVCAPSRAAIIMGAHQMSFGGQHMRTSTRPEGPYKTVPPANMKAFPELLRAAGYYTYNTQKLDYQFSGPMSGSGPFTIWDDDSQDAHWRKKQTDQPFFGYVTFMVTHESGVFPPLGAKPYSPRHAMMQQWRAKGLGIPPVNSPVDAKNIKLEPYYPDTPTVREDVVRHYNNIAIMDKQVGDMLAQLKEDGLLENTIVIWTTDHGDGLPRAKRELYDSGIKVPMVIRWPDKYKPADAAEGAVDERLISFVDLAPTILGLAGVTSPDFIQGRDFLKPNTPKRDYIYAERDRIDEVPDRQRAVRDSRFKYIYSHYPEQIGGHELLFRDNIPMMREMRALFDSGELNDAQSQWFTAPGQERLFDLNADPHEVHDVLNKPEYAADVARLRKALGAWQANVDDWSNTPENQMVDGFQKDGKTGITAQPTITVGELISIHSDVDGASIGYQIDGGPWQLYSQPFAKPTGTTLSAKAIRYGWEESGVVSVQLAILGSESADSDPVSTGLN